MCGKLSGPDHPEGCKPMWEREVEEAPSSYVTPQWPGRTNTPTTKWDK